MGDGTYNLSNFGRRINCTISVLFPTSFRLNSYQIGSEFLEGSNEVGIECMFHGLPHSFVRFDQCVNESISEQRNDYMKIRGGDGLDSHLMTTIETICGLSNGTSEFCKTFCESALSYLI